MELNKKWGQTFYKKKMWNSTEKPPIQKTKRRNSKIPSIAYGKSKPKPKAVLQKSNTQRDIWVNFI